MKAKDPVLWAATRLYRILAKTSSSAELDDLSSFSALLEAQKSVQESWRLYLKAQSRGWTHAAAIHHRGLFLNIARVNCESTDVRPRRPAPIPALADIAAELRCLKGEFDQFEILPREKQIRVTTDEIVLEDVRLGPFCIQLHFERLARCRDVSAFRVVAREPNPAAGNSSCTHPHVEDKALCAGDAKTPISHALAEGRISDAFQLVNRVLHTYNRSSAYVALSEWDGQSCSDCGRTQPSDSLYSCERCNQDYCDECIRKCDGCSQSICLECSVTNEAGDRLCPKCKKIDDQKREAAREKEEEIAASEKDEPPQPPTETTHHDEHAHAPDLVACDCEFPGGAPCDGGNQAVAVAASPPQAA